MKALFLAPSAAVAAIGVAFAPPLPSAHADNEQDQVFYRLLVEGDNHWTIWNFSGMRAQALRACELMTRGQRHGDE
jgi:hypothetical protein